MKIRKENRCGKSHEKDRSYRSTGKNLSKLANACSLFCSAVGTSLVASISFGPRNTLSYGNVQLAKLCATGFLVAAFLLGILGAVLSFKKNSKKYETIVEKVGDTELYEDSGAFKISEVKTANPLHSDEAVAPNSIELKSQRLISDASVGDLRTRSKTASDRRHKDTNLPANTLKSKTSVLFTTKDDFPLGRNQLVPVQKQYDIPPFQECRTMTIPSDNTNRWNFISKGIVGIDSITEVVATKRVRFLSGDYAHRQEEYEVKQTTTFFKYPHAGKISEITYDQQNKLDTQTGFYPSENTTKSQGLSDVISKFQFLQFKQ